MRSGWLGVVMVTVAGCEPLPGVLEVGGEVDFGVATCPTSRTIALRNTGVTSLKVDLVKHRSGSLVEAAPFLDEPGAEFRLSLPPSLVVEPGAGLAIPATWTPPVDGGAGAREARLAFVAGTQQVEVALRGTAPPVGLEAPGPVDFFGAAPGDPAEVPFPTSDGGSALSLPTGGPFFATADGLRFDPPSPGEFEAVAWWAPAACFAATPVRLRGTGVLDLFSWTEASTDFGYVPVGHSATATITFHDFASRPVLLTGIGAWEGANPSTRFAVEAASGDPSTLTVPRATRGADGGIQPGDASLTVRFTPANEGPTTGSLRITTDLPSQASLRVTLRGAGGGPDIEVSPSPLDLGAVTTTSTTVVRVRNVGTRPALSNPAANLRLGADGGQPYFELVPRSGATGNLSVSGPTGYPPLIGLEAIATAEAVLMVTATPSGPSEHELRIFSNDPDEPVTVVLVITR